MTLSGQSELNEQGHRPLDKSAYLQNDCVLIMSTMIQ